MVGVIGVADSREAAMARAGPAVHRSGPEAGDARSWQDRDAALVVHVVLIRPKGTGEPNSQEPGEEARPQIH